MIDRAELFAELLAAGRPATLRARGGSMWPALRDGDVLTVAPGPVRRGDIVAVRCGEALVVHRVVRLEGGRLVLRGDALPREDGAFAPEAVLGRVVSVRRGRRAAAPGSGRFSPLSRLLLHAARRLPRLAAAEPRAW